VWGKNLKKQKKIELFIFVSSSSSVFFFFFCLLRIIDEISFLRSFHR